MPRKIDCWVELKDHRAVRIFKNTKAAAEAEAAGAYPFLGNRAEAIEQIRRQVFERDAFICIHCGKVVTWEIGEMHERIWKGRGGEVSVENCETRCHACNMLEHDRNPKFGKSCNEPSSL